MCSLYHALFKKLLIFINAHIDMPTEKQISLFRIVLTLLFLGLLGRLTHVKNPKAKLMTIADAIMDGKMVTIVGILGHEFGHAYGMKEGGGAYRFQAIIEKMYRNQFWTYDNIQL